MDERKVLIGVPSVRGGDKFLSSIYTFISSLKGSYEVSLLIEKCPGMAKAQNRIAQYAIDNGFEYLLLCEDDVYGHSKEMLDALVKADAPVASMQAYQRNFPYPNLLMIEDQGIEKDSGYGEITLTGFHMCLIRIDVLKDLGSPYFIEQPSECVAWDTSVNFFARLREKNIKVLGCWDYCLDNSGVNQKNVRELRERNAPPWIVRFMAQHPEIYGNLPLESK
jgi:hypothetical protein